MRTIAHIVNPVIVSEGSDLLIAQPITFRTMETARDAARGKVDVELFTAQYVEDRPLIPAGWTATPDLTRSVLDVGTFRQPRKLPLLQDILDRLYGATDAEYLIYTNVDIGLMPDFYTAVSNIINTGYDALSINRRTISDRFTSIDEILQMYQEVGARHRGHDCFVFRRNAYPRYFLGDVCIGINCVGQTLLHNMARYATRYKKITDEHLTFHIGNTQTWGDFKWADYWDHNMRQMADVYIRKGEN